MFRNAPNPEPSILVVDDDPEIRDTISAILRFVGFRHIDVARDGLEATEYTDRNKYDLILCDWVMPRMDGMGFLHYLRAEKKHRKIPFILITAEASPKDVEDAIKAGVDTHIVKPFDSETLTSRIFQYLPVPQPKRR